MTYKEFCSQVECTVSAENYEMVEALYRGFERFATMNDVVDFYKKHSPRGVTTLYRELKRHAAQKSKVESLRSELPAEERKLFEMELISGIRT